LGHETASTGLSQMPFPQTVILPLQSPGQFAMFSPSVQTPSPQKRPLMQSEGQFVGLSPTAQKPSPHLEGIVQSAGHVCPLSSGPQVPSPQIGQSTGQLPRSPEVHAPSPQT
jgi:hypothetical protein